MRVRLKLEALNDVIARSSLSQNHWAIKLGLSRGHWSGIVNGRHPYPSARTRERMLEVLKVGFDELFEIEQGPPAWSDQNFQAAMADRYLIDKEIGHGGMGTVFLARDVKHGRAVAVKVLSPEVVSGIGIEQFLKEIRYTARLQHHHILPLFDSGEAAGSPFYVMPYVRAGSLRRRLEEQGRLSVPEAIGLTRGVATALTHAHANHVLHCDVKPENVLLSDDHAFVADFGISRAIHAEALEWGRRTDIDSSAGTPAYVSPEQATGEPSLDARADVYSLGCMVFEMLVGRKPFEGKNAMEIVSRRFTDDPPNLAHYAPEVPTGVASAVAGAMELNTRRRFQSVKAFVDALAAGAAQNDSPVRMVIHRSTARVANSVRRAVGAKPGTRSDWSKTRKMFDALKQDLGYAVRTLKRTPGFSALVVLTLAFGIAANTFVFSMLNPYFLRPLPFGEPDRLVHFGLIDPVTGWHRVRVSAAMHADYAERSEAFEGVAYYVYGSRTLTGDQGVERVGWTRMSDNAFEVLRVGAAMGRVFQSGEGGPGAPDVVVLSDALWRRRYGGDDGIVGRSIAIDGTPHTVIGVMPERFNFPFGTIDMWVPDHADPVGEARDRTINEMFGRLAPGWTIERATPEINAVHRQLATLYPELDGRYSGVSVRPMRESLNFAWDILRIAFAVMLAGVGLALIVACVNVASLMLARATARAQEVAVRAALGAGRSRIVRQLLTESSLLALSGGVVGVLVSVGLVRVVGPVIPADLYRVGEASVDGTVLLFTLVVTALTPLVFGLAPALRAARTNLSDALRSGSRGGSERSGMFWRRFLVVCQVTLAVVIVSGMGLTLRSLQAAQRMDLGFQPEQKIVVTALPPVGDYPEPSDYAVYHERAEAAVRAVAGVGAVGRVQHLPMNNETSMAQFARPGRVPERTEDWPLAIRNWAGPGYFSAIGIAVLQGREFTDADRELSDVVVVSRGMAEQLWPGESPIGQTLIWGDTEDPRQSAVVGVVADVQQEDFGTLPRPIVYAPYDYDSARRQFLVVQVSGTLASVAPAVQGAVRAIDPNMPVTVRPMSDIVGEKLLQWRLSSGVLGALGIGTLLLATLGIYGVLAYAVTQRRKEIGVRMALGAEPTQVTRRFLGEGLFLGAIGVGVGAVIALVGGQLAASFLFGVTPSDPVTLVSVVIIFGGVAAMASFLPARRASRVDPLTVLRYE